MTEALLQRAGTATDDLVRAVLSPRNAGEVSVDEIALARIARERDEATRKSTQTRDVVAWQAQMAKLDAQDGASPTPSSGAG